MLLQLYIINTLIYSINLPFGSRQIMLLSDNFRRKLIVNVGKSKVKCSRYVKLIVNVGKSKVKKCSRYVKLRVNVGKSTVKCSRYVKLTVNVGKSKVKCSRYINAGRMDVGLNVEPLEEVDCFIYQGSQADGGCERDVVREMNYGNTAKGAIKRFAVHWRIVDKCEAVSI